MASEINTNNIRTNVNSISNNKSNRSSETQKDPSSLNEVSKQSTTDKVAVTDTAVKLQAIEARLADIPEVDAKKVAEIKQAIAEGKFEIDPGRVAEKLIAFESGK